MNEGITIDANIFVAAQDSSEVHYRTSFNILQNIQARPCPVYIPAMFIFEVTTVLHRKKLQNVVNESQVHSMFSLLKELPFLSHWDLDILEDAEHMASRLGFKRVHDCAYVAVAKKRKIPLVTLDEQLIARGKNFYSEIFHASEFRFDS